MPDPAAFFALPIGVQALWIEHAANEWSGAYHQERKKD